MLNVSQQKEGVMPKTKKTQPGAMDYDAKKAATERNKKLKKQIDELDDIKTPKLDRDRIEHGYDREDL